MEKINNCGQNNCFMICFIKSKREGSTISATLITFQQTLQFGFAHHTYWENPRQIQTELQHSFVVIYVKSGELKAKIYDKVFSAPMGSLLILFRHFPFELYTEDNVAQDYCSIQV